MSKTMIIILFITLSLLLFLASRVFPNTNNQEELNEPNDQFWNKNRYDEHRDDIFLEDE